MTKSNSYKLGYHQYPFIELRYVIGGFRQQNNNFTYHIGIRFPFFFLLVYNWFFTINITYTWIGGKWAISCAARPFWVVKSLLVNTTFMDLWDITLLCITLWTLCRRSATSDARKPKASKANGIKVCWLSEHAFSCLVTLLDAAFRAECPTVKAPTLKPTSGETSVKSTHACFPPTHPYTITSACLSVDLLSNGSVKSSYFLWKLW